MRCTLEYTTDNKRPRGTKGTTATKANVKILLRNLKSRNIQRFAVYADCFDSIDRITTCKRTARGWKCSKVRTPTTTVYKGLPRR